jgi:hypothetical protein
MVRHTIDAMHVKKNVCEALINTLLDIPGKTKDTLKARMNLDEMKLRKDIHYETLENGSKKTSNSSLHPKKIRKDELVQLLAWN